MITIKPDSMGLDKIISCNIPVHVRKTAVTYARLMTQADANQCYVSPQRSTEKPVAGHVWTKEGPVKFEVGDMLCRGIEGDDDVAEVRVSWGDGTIGTTEHRYLDDGVYQLSVRVIDEQGNIVVSFSYGDPG